MSDLFAGIPVSNFGISLGWYEKLLGSEPSFFPHETEAVWELGASQYVYIVENPDHAGHSRVMLMVSNLQSRISDIENQGLVFDRVEEFPNNVQKVTFKDADGNEFSFGGTLSNGEP